MIDAVERSRLVELRLTAFKSFRDEVLPLSRTTILIGRNSSGKSNALDALEVLARLAEGDDLADALDARHRPRGAIRGGSIGCPPHGDTRFALGCSVEVDGQRYDYDLVVEVKPRLRIVRESLDGPDMSSDLRFTGRVPLIRAVASDEPADGLSVTIHDGRPEPVVRSGFRDNRLTISQISLPFDTYATLATLHGATAVLRNLRGIFHLDPVPHLMRDFTPQHDSDLRRTGENLSAVLHQMKDDDPETFGRVQELVRAVSDTRVHGIDFATTELGDVMLVLNEARHDDIERTPAREMSDGLLRFTAVATALLSTELDLNIEHRVADELFERSDGTPVEDGVLVVIEELENGLHPSQARRVLDLVRADSETSDTSVIVTTHSPAILNAVDGSLNSSVVVCHRDRNTGRSLLTSLPEVPGYATALAEGPLGDAVTAGKLNGDPDEDPGDYSEFERLLGLR